MYVKGTRWRYSSKIKIKKERLDERKGRNRKENEKENARAEGIFKVEFDAIKVKGRKMKTMQVRDGKW